MPWTGNGTYQLPAGGGTVVTGTIIQSTWANSFTSDLTNVLNNVVCRDGQASLTNPLQLATGSPLNPSLTFNTDSSTGMFLYGTSPTTGLGFATQGTLALTINSTGNLVIAAPTTGTALSVNGNVVIVPVITSTSPSPNIALTVDGNTVITATSGTALNITGNTLMSSTSGGNALGVTGSVAISSPPIGSSALAITGLAPTSATNAPLTVTGPTTQIGFGIAGGFGGYLTSTASNNSFLNAGCYDGGAAWIATSTSASLFALSAGTFEFYGNTGLTAGSSFIPTTLVDINASGDITSHSSQTAGGFVGQNASITNINSAGLIAAANLQANAIAIGETILTLQSTYPGYIFAIDGNGVCGGTFTGNVINANWMQSGTRAANDNTTYVATTAFVQTAVASSWVVSSVSVTLTNGSIYNISGYVSGNNIPVMMSGFSCVTSGTSAFNAIIYSYNNTGASGSPTNGLQIMLYNGSIASYPSAWTFLLPAGTLSVKLVASATGGTCTAVVQQIAVS
jgi:hypothetical protein